MSKQSATLSEALASMEQAANFVKRFENLHKAISYAAGLEQNTKELEASVTALKATVDLLKAEEQDAKDGIGKALTEAKEIKAGSKANADAAAKAAKEKADAILAEAEGKAANAAAKQADAEKAASQALADVVAKQAELSDLETKIAKLRAQAAKLLGE